MNFDHSMIGKFCGLVSGTASEAARLIALESADLVTNLDYCRPSAEPYCRGHGPRIEVKCGFEVFRQSWQDSLAVLKKDILAALRGPSLLLIRATDSSTPMDLAPMPHYIWSLRKIDNA